MEHTYVCTSDQIGVSLPTVSQLQFTFFWLLQSLVKVDNIPAPTDNEMKMLRISTFADTLARTNWRKAQTRHPTVETAWTTAEKSTPVSETPQISQIRSQTELPSFTRNYQLPRWVKRFTKTRMQSTKQQDVGHRQSPFTFFSNCQHLCTRTMTWQRVRDDAWPAAKAAGADESGKAAEWEGAQKARTNNPEASVLFQMFTAFCVCCLVKRHEHSEIWVRCYVVAGPPVDCEVSQWTDWAPCSKTCGFGSRSRRRYVARKPENAGRPCPLLVQTELCGSMRSCGWKHFRFGPVFDKNWDRVTCPILQAGFVRFCVDVGNVRLPLLDICDPVLL